MNTPQALKHGFTLIELLVATVIVSLLAGIAYTGYGAAQRLARRAKETSAVKSLINAYLAYPADHNGLFLPGYQPGASVELPGGEVLSGPTAERYPWRLAEYAELDVGRTMRLNPAKQGGSDTENYHYLVSLVPSLGLNAYCLGGYQTARGHLAKAHCAVGMQQLAAGTGGNIIVFASARMSQQGTQYEGNFIIKPPTMTAATNLDARHGGKAVVAYLDGHVETNTLDELRDARKWSPFAKSETERIRP